MVKQRNRAEIDTMTPTCKQKRERNGQTEKQGRNRHPDPNLQAKEGEEWSNRETETLTPTCKQKRERNGQTEKQGRKRNPDPNLQAEEVEEWSNRNRAEIDTLTPTCK